MEQARQPLLTIGIIFKNEIRSLEQCLKALAPLRDRIACELILADTGSTDGSRRIAERYADTLIDFPWINDFAAARNAVLGRASGKWYLTVDTDEYLDTDISELVEFLRADGEGRNLASLVVRNYETEQMDGDYADFMAVRLVRLLPGVHYEGAVHEQLVLPRETGRRIVPLAGTLLHHDGYAKTTEEAERAKQDRNRALLRGKLAEEPENLSVLVHYIESSRGREDYLGRIRQSVRLVEEKKPDWEYFGPAVLRNAVRAAYEAGLETELAEWSAQAEKLFPESFLIRIDVECYACAHSWNKGDYTDCIRRGQRYLAAIEEYRAGRGERGTLLSSVVFLASPAKERQTRQFLTEACLKIGETERAGEFLGSILQSRAGKRMSAEEMEELLWLEKAVQEAVREFDWSLKDRTDRNAGVAETNGEDEAAETQKANGKGMALARLFARVEEGFLPVFYEAEALCEENIARLPAERQFGWYCLRAFASLDAGDLAGYVRQLKAGLDACAERKDMVKYLTEETPELKRLAPSPELLELAKQVRTILSLYPADSPEIVALKATSVYKQVAWLVEGGGVSG